jgi:hypothetical protein
MASTATRAADSFANPAGKLMANWARAKMARPSPAAVLPLPPANTNAAAARSIIDNSTDVESLQDGNLQLQATIPRSQQNPTLFNPQLLL